MNTLYKLLIIHVYFSPESLLFLRALVISHLDISDLSCPGPDRLMTGLTSNGVQRSRMQRASSGVQSRCSMQRASSGVQRCSSMEQLGGARGGSDKQSSNTNKHLNNDSFCFKAEEATP